MIVKRVIKNNFVVVGGGVCEVSNIFIYVSLSFNLVCLDGDIKIFLSLFLNYYG